MASIDGAALSVATVSITTSITAFYQFLPSISEVRKNSPNDPEFAADVRMGEIAASIIALGVGAVFSSLAGSAIPVFGSLIIAAGLVFLYENILRGNRLFEVNGNG